MDSDATPEKLYPDIADAGGASPVLAAEDAKRKELELELANTEEEIATLRQVLHAKEAHAADLRKALGITTLSQLKAEINKVQSSQAYKKTSETLKSAGQATASVFNTIGTSVSNKFSEMKNSPTFKSFEEKVEGVGTTIMAKVSGTTKDEEKGDGISEPTSEPPVTQQPGHTDDLPM